MNSPVVRIAGSLLICLSLLSGCQRSTGTVLGKVPSRETQTVLSVRAGNTPPEVNVRGLLVEKCPTAGCWFRLRDRTGTIKVDTKNAGFVVVGIPLQTEITVAGKIVPEGDDVLIQAVGVRY